MSQEINKHLSCVLSSHNIENDKKLIQAYRDKKKELKVALSGKFGSDIFHCFDSGSYKKSTAVNSKFDLDIGIPFKKNGDTLESNYDAIFIYFDDEYEDAELISQPKKQKVSIGLEFFVNSNVLDFDIVPGREINDYEEDRDLNLYFNDTMGVIEAKSHIKTNIHCQVDHITKHSEAREVIKLLKVWRQHTGYSSLKSFLIELLTIRAFQDNQGSIPTDLWGKLEMTLEYIHTNIERIQLIDPGNSNNNVADSLNAYQKTDLVHICNRILEDVEREDESIEKHFPVNPEYPCDEGNKSPYIVISTDQPDRIPDNDFGIIS